MPYTIYTLLSFASAISLTVLCFVILGISIPYIEGSRKVRYARVVLAVAYFVIALPGYLELISVPVVDPLIVAAFTISAAAYEALLITETLITLMCPQDINRKSIFLHLVSVSAVVMLFLLSVFVYRRFFILYLGAVFCILLYIYYIRLFNIEYKKFRTTMEEYYDEGQYYKLRWSAISFYSSLVVGLLALVAPFGPIVLYDIFTIGYITFYIMFTIRFGNYVMQLNYYLPAILSKNRVTKPDEVNAYNGDRVKLNEATVGDKLKGNKEIDKLKNSLQEWVRNEQYLNSDKSIEEVAHELNTDISFLRWYFNTQMDKDFRTYRVELRIEYAKRLLAENPQLSINSISYRAGFNTKANFYTYFKKYVGVSPAEYLRDLKRGN